MTMDNNTDRIKFCIKAVPNFPKPGILFRDITSLLSMPNGKGISMVTEELVKLKELNFNKIVAIEARGFIFGSMLAQVAGKPLVLARKPGKLPKNNMQKKYSLEYGENRMCVQINDIKKEDNVIVIDDLLATGGTAKAVCDIVEALGGNVAACYFLVELDGLGGRELLEKADIKVVSSVHYE